MSVPDFQQSDVQEAIIRRIESLEADLPALWGKMNCAQMLYHCRKPFEVAFGESELKRGLIGLLFGGFAKKKFVDSDEPFNQGSPTMPEFLDRAAGGEEVAAHKQALIGEVKRFVSGVPRIGVHPFFGKLTPLQWDRLMWKHLDHHLRQFGC